MKCETKLRQLLLAGVLSVLVWLVQPCSTLAAAQGAVGREGSKSVLVAPQWQTGDTWTVVEIARNESSPGDKWTKPLGSVYRVVRRTVLGGAACLVVEKWPEHIDRHQAGFHTVYYYRATDKALLRQTEYYYVQGELRSHSTDFAPVAGVPGSDGEWLPSFSGTCEDAASQASAAGVTGAPGRYASQEVAAVAADVVLRLSSSAAVSGIKPQVPKTGGCLQVAIVLGTKEEREKGRTAVARQYWCPGFPWCVYEERERRGRLVWKRWLVSHGRGATSGNPVEPSEAQPLGRNAAGRGAEAASGSEAVGASTETAAAAEPWAGWYWPFYDGNDPNLYDTTGSWQPMKRYDDCIRPGKTDATDWERSTHWSSDDDFSGHCHAWCGACIHEEKPSVDRGCLTRGDLEGLLVECYYNLYGPTWPPTSSPADAEAMPPGDFWLALRYNIRDRNRPVPMDLYTGTTPPPSGYNDPIWNHPVYAYEIQYSLKSGVTYDCTAKITYKLDGMNPGVSGYLPEHRATRTLKFTVDMHGGDPDSGSGSWDPGTGTDRPDYAWYPDSRVTGNDHVDYDTVKDIIAGDYPQVTSFQINGGAASAKDRKVTLDNATNGKPTEYMASESASFAGASWQPYSDKPEFELSAGDGDKTVYFKAKTCCGESKPRSDTIKLNQSKLDIIFTIDGTGSMWDDIDAVKAAASLIVNTLSSLVPDYRFALVNYRDFPEDPYGEPSDFVFRDVVAFTDDVPTILNGINSLGASGGRDWPEAVYSAMMHSFEATSLGGWRNDAKKIVLPMGDAPPHDPEPFTGYTLATVVAEAFAVDPATVFAVVVGNDAGAIYYFSELSEQTGGQMIPAANASEVVDAILEALVKITQSPVAEAGGPYSGSVGMAIPFDASASYDPDGTIVKYEWDWEGDGTYDETTAVPVVSHTYSTEFTGQIRLRVTDNDGLTGVDTANVVISAVIPAGCLDLFRVYRGDPLLVPSSP